MYCDAEKEYRDMVLDKTGGLFRLALRLMQCFSTIPLLSSECNEGFKFSKLIDLLSLYFQIRDDLLNLCRLVCIVLFVVYFNLSILATSTCRRNVSVKI